MNAKTCLSLLVFPCFLLACSFSSSLDAPNPSPRKPTGAPVVISTEPVAPTPWPTVTPDPLKDQPWVEDCPTLPGPDRPAQPGFLLSSALGTNVAIDKPVISRAGGVSYPDWGNALDSEDYNTTTRAENGRWGNQTNTGAGTYQVIDLGQVYTLNGVGYSLDWDGAFSNPLAFQVLVSTNNETWWLVASSVHRYSGGGLGNQVNIDLSIPPTPARYVKYVEPPDGDWNGWGDLFQLRAYAEE